MKKTRATIENLGDDLLTLICSYVVHPNDRLSFSKVNKSWRIVEAHERSTLKVVHPINISKILPRFPNLVNFHMSTLISNSIMHCLADSCPRIQVLDLSCDEESYLVTGTSEDFDGEALSAIAKGCPDLQKVILKNRKGIRSVASFTEFSRNLKYLDLDGCSKISDETLESIGSMNTLETLSLQGCGLITDVGLALLTKGSLCKVLKNLSLARCVGITDAGLFCLKNISGLEYLDLEFRGGDKITDAGGKLALAEITSLRALNLSGLHSLSTTTLIALAKNCRKLEVLYLMDCSSEAMASGILAFSSNEWIQIFPCTK